MKEMIDQFCFLFPREHVRTLNPKKLKISDNDGIFV